MENKQERRILIDPIMMVLRSRRVIIAIVSLIVGLLVLYVPQLEALHEELIILLVSLTLALIGGLSLEDAVIASRQVPPRTDIKEQIREVLDVIVDEALVEAEQSLWRSSGDVEETRPQNVPN